MMNWTFHVAALTLTAAMMLPSPATADDWVRLDRPWTNWELTRAITFCRQQPRLNPGTRQFVDQLMGKQIQTCMYTLGWIGVSR